MPEGYLRKASGGPPTAGSLAKPKTAPRRTPTREPFPGHAHPRPIRANRLQKSVPIRGLFIVTGGRIEYGSPAMIMGLLKGNELSYDQPYWDGENEAYKEGIRSEDLGFFNQAGRTKFTQTIPETHKGITVNKDVEEVGWDYGVGLKDQKTTQIYVDGALTKKESYALNCDSAVRLDSALLYHYWDNLNDPRFLNPRENNAKQTYILNHADMKGVVIKDEIVVKPKNGSWQDHILKKIQDDNQVLIKNISSFINE